MQQYVFLRDKDTRQVHIYQAEVDEEGHVYCSSKPECGNRNSRNGEYGSKEKDEDGYVKVYNEDGARRHCPAYGRPLCGNCVGTLYSDCE